MANTIVAQELWENRLAQRLDKPQNWKEICDVMYTDTQTTVLPYISAANEPAVQTGWLANAAARSTLTNVVTSVSVTMSTETLAIVSTEYDSVYIDYADQAQSNYAKIAGMADLLGDKLNERIEALTLAQHASLTDFGDAGGGAPGLGTSQLTVSVNNVDDIIRGINEQIITANGYELYRKNGGFVCWRAADWNALTAFMMANGFSQADMALSSGGKIGVDYMGLTHLVSTQHTANHLFAGVKKIIKLGLLKSTFGKVFVSETPSSSGADGILSGTQVHVRADYGFKVQTNVKPVVFDVNVA